jgi:hypothetical protein
VAIFRGPIGPGIVRPTQELLGSQNGEQFGQVVAAANIVGGPEDDVIIGSPYFTQSLPSRDNRGRVQVFSSTSTGISTTPNTTLIGRTNNDYFGSYFAVGDVIGGGFAELAIGRLSAQAVLLFFSNGTTVNPIEQRTVLMPPGTEGVAWQIALADVTGDPYADLIIGAPLANGNLGRVHIFRGTPTAPWLSDPAIWILSPPSWLNFGSFLTIGNAFGSALNELVITSQQQVFIYGQPQLPCPTITINPTNPTLSAGRAGTPYSQAFTATGGAAPYSFSISAGTLPPGLGSSSGGLLSGVPTGFGTFNFTVKATEVNGCMGTQAYTLVINPPCPTITVNPPLLPNGTVGAPYNQTLTATAGTAPYSFNLTAGGLPQGLSLSSGGVISGTPTTAGPFSFTVTATDANGCTGSRGYSVTISGGAVSGLLYYPLPSPVRLLDTRPNFQACDAAGTPLAGGTDRTEPARTPCSGIPANARAIVGNATVVNFISGGGYITLYPSDASRPNASNLNFTANHIVPNSFTVGLGANGASKIFTSADTHFIVDITGYYAPPGAGGLYIHPLPSPVRLLDTRPDPTFPSCFFSNTPLVGNSTLSVTALGNCDGAIIPSSAKSLVGNATVVNFQSAGGYITLFPEGSPPNASNLNFTTNHIIANAFVVGLNGGGSFNIFASASTNFIVDITGYFSDQEVDLNGRGLLFYPLSAPARWLDTRPNPFVSCIPASMPLAANSTSTLMAQLTCEGQTIPARARSVLGNATVVNFISSGGYITLFPSDVAQPNASNLNFTANQIVPNSFVVGLSNDGKFKIFTSGSTHFIVDLSGYFAP